MEERIRKILKKVEENRNKEKGRGKGRGWWDEKCREKKREVRKTKEIEKGGKKVGGV